MSEVSSGANPDQPAGPWEPLQRRHYGDQEIATGRHRVEHVAEGGSEVPVAKPGLGGAAGADDLGDEVVAPTRGGLVESAAGVEDVGGVPDAHGFSLGITAEGGGGGGEAGG